MTDGYVVRDRTVPYKGHIFTVVADEVQMPAGNRSPREYLDHPGAVGVVALDDQDRILLVEQYRHPVGARMWELPAGLIDHPGEDLADAAARELAEEAGMTADHWELLVDLHTTPGCSNEIFRCYLGRGLRPLAEQTFVRDDEEAGIVTAFVPLDEAVARVLGGGITNAACMIGILAAARLRDAGWPQSRPLDAALPRQPLAPVQPADQRGPGAG
ncbi:MAG TPA: NUDIX hydrolase [Micromonosporaceae bacterium]|jgi:ADP-ribose pyrophosphatase